MKKEIYNFFTDKKGNVYSFENYIDFSMWFFSIKRKNLLTFFDEKTFKKLHFSATKSKKSKEKIN